MLLLFYVLPLRFLLLLQMGDETECLDWLVSLSATLAKAPYKDTDNALTLVNTSRTDVSISLARTGPPDPNTGIFPSRYASALRCGRPRP